MTVTYYFLLKKKKAKDVSYYLENLNRRIFI